MATLTTWDEFTAGGKPQDGTIRELVLEEVTNVISRRRPLFSNLSSINVNNTFVEHLEDTLGSRAHNATLEGAAFTNPALSQATRIFQSVQSFAEWGVVSDEQRMVGHYNEDPFIYQSRKKLNEMLNDVEHALHRGSAATGATSATRQFAGLLNLFSTPTFTDSSGTTLTEEVLVDLLQLFRDNNYDVVPSQCYVGSWLKRTISEFSTRVTRNVDAMDRTQVLIVERHASDFGDLDVFYSEDQLQSATKTTQGNSIVFIDPDFFMKGWLKAPTIEQLARDGLRDRFQINAHCTLVYKTTKGGGGGTGYVPYIGQV